MPAEANMREIEGLLFYAVRKTDRPFAKAMGLDVQGGTPWDSAPILAYITSLRNKAMDDAILKAEAEDDASAADAIASSRADLGGAACTSAAAGAGSAPTWLAAAYASWRTY